MFFTSKLCLVSNVIKFVNFRETKLVGRLKLLSDLEKFFFYTLEHVLGDTLMDKVKYSSHVPCLAAHYVNTYCININVPLHMSV